MRLVRDVLDNQLVDRNGFNMGKADGILVEIRRDAPPRIVAIETGLVTKARRLSPALAKWLARRSRPYRIPWRLVRDVGIDIEVDLDAEETPVLNLEKRLRKFLSRIPFA